MSQLNLENYISLTIVPDNDKNDNRYDSWSVSNELISFVSAK